MLPKETTRKQPGDNLHALWEGLNCEDREKYHGEEVSGVGCYNSTVDDIKNVRLQRSNDLGRTVFR